MPSPEFNELVHAAKYDAKAARSLCLRFSEEERGSDRDLFSLQSVGRFLVARDHDIEKSEKMLRFAYEYRKNRGVVGRQLSNSEPELLREGRTGKIYLCERFDHHGRPVIVFDNSVQNTSGREGQMKYMSWYLELAIKAMSLNSMGLDVNLRPSRWVIFINLTRFSILNNPPWKTTMETLDVLMTCYAERMGCVICYGCPSFFLAVKRLVMPLLDKRTSNKVVIIGGNPNPADELRLCDILGHDWREITNVNVPYTDNGMSQGYVHSRQWKMARDIERRFNVNFPEGAESQIEGLGLAGTVDNFAITTSSTRAKESSGVKKKLASFRKLFRRRSKTKQLSVNAMNAELRTRASKQQTLSSSSKKELAIKRTVNVSDSSLLKISLCCLFVVLLLRMFVATQMPNSSVLITVPCSFSNLATGRNYQDN